MGVRGDPFPQVMNVSLRYGQLVTLTAGVAGVYGTEQVFRLNSLYDPDLTGTGHQPYGFDTLSSIYFHYKVTAVTVSMIFSDPSADGVQIAANFQSPGTTFTVTGESPNTAMEKPGMMIRNLNNTGSQKVTFTQRFPMHILCNVTKTQFEADLLNYESAVTTNPSLVPYLRIAIAALDGASVPTVRCQTDIIYHTQFRLRTVLAVS